MFFASCLLVSSCVRTLSDVIAYALCYSICSLSEDHVVGAWILKQLTTCVCLCRVYTCVYISIGVFTCIHGCIHKRISFNKLKHFSGDPTLF